MSIDDALLGANPNFRKKSGYGDNCQRCVQAYELRRRGFNVEAQPRPNKKKDIITWGNECFVDEKGKTPKFVYGLTEKTIKKQIKDAPNNARFIIHAEWGDGISHVFIAEKENGNVRFVDPQTGRMDASNYFAKGVDGAFGILRTDDKAITTNADIINATMKGVGKSGK